MNTQLVSHKKALFLDDEPWRWETFRLLFSDAVWVKTAPEAIKWLQKESFDFVSLDHDLGLNFENGNGMDVAKFIVERGLQIPYICIHSWNMPAGSNMHQCIYESGLCPNLRRGMFSKDVVLYMYNLIEG